MNVNSLAHTKWECKYHIVFAPIFEKCTKTVLQILSWITTAGIWKNS